MRFSQFLTEATELGKLGFSRPFVRAVFKDTYIEHDAQFKEVTKKDLKTDSIFGSLVVALTKNGEVAIVGSHKSIYVDGKSTPGFFTIVVDKNGKETRTSRRTAEALALIPAGSTIYMADLKSTFYMTRSGQKADLDNEKVDTQNWNFIEYMQETFGPALKREAESAMDFIFKGMKHLDKRTRLMTHSTTEAEQALKLAAFIEEVAENGFSKKAAEEWYQAERGFGSVAANIERLAKKRVEPAAAAQFAKVIFKKIRDAKNEVAFLLKNRMAIQMDRFTKKSK